MKKITFIRCLAFMVMLFTTTTGFSQTIFANLTPSNSTACPPAGCTANDVKIGEVYLADANGNRLTTCNSGDPITTQYLWVQITDASSKYGLYMQFNMYKGTQEIDENGANISDGNTNKITVGDNRQITPGNYRMMALPSYTCGDFITLKDIYLAWQTPPGGQATTVTPGCAGTSKCSAENLPNTIIVNTPLAVNFTYNPSCTGNTYQQVTFTNTSTGGDGTLTYLWNFGAGATPSTSSASGNSPNPIIVTYSSSGTKTVSLKITDRDGDTDTETKSIEVGTCCTIAINSITKTNIACYGNLNGTVTATKTGGTGTITYDLLRSDTSGGTFSASGLPTNGDSTGSYTGLGVGYYKVIVSEANGCNVTSSEVQITQPTALTASVTAQTNVNCYGNNSGSITVAGANGTAPYSYAIDGTTFGNSGTFGTLAAGSYTVTVKDANNCTTTQNFTITQPAAALSATISNSTNVNCYGGATGSAT
ncbi:PKD domain-containing protein, partial [Flavobacterium glycines]